MSHSEASTRLPTLSRWHAEAILIRPSRDIGARSCTGLSASSNRWLNGRDDAVLSIPSTGMDDDMLLDPGYLELHARLEADEDGERTWPDVIEFVRRHSSTLAAVDLVEDVANRYDDAFSSRLEREAKGSPDVARVVLRAWPEDQWLGELQERLRRSGYDDGSLVFE
jgi:hypothetical protein